MSDAPDVPAVEVCDLVKRFRHATALAGVTFVVRRGEVLGLLGPNGAG
jgi:ABC-type multidrug transport system ATPase subunit